MNKVILITGASSGIGKDAAKQFVREGHTVYTAARSVDKMADLAELGAHVIGMDVTKEEMMVEAVDRIIEEQGRINVLINCAGFGLYGAVEDTKIEDARYQFEVNLFGLARLTQLVLPHMRKQESGTIINISSMGGKIYTLLGAWYHATKHALEGWSDCLRLEVAPFGIDVVIVEPGAIQTEFGSVMTDPMMKRSGNTAYAEMAKKMAAAAEKSYEKGQNSPVSVITKVLSKAVRAKKPKTRYAAGYMAKPTIFLRKIPPDRWFDKLILSAT